MASTLNTYSQNMPEFSKYSFHTTRKWEAENTIFSGSDHMLYGEKTNNLWEFQYMMNYTQIIYRYKQEGVWKPWREVHSFMDETIFNSSFSKTYITENLTFEPGVHTIYTNTMVDMYSYKPVSVSVADLYGGISGVQFVPYIHQEKQFSLSYYHPGTINAIGSMNINVRYQKNLYSM